MLKPKIVSMVFLFLFSMLAMNISIIPVNATNAVFQYDYHSSSLQYDSAANLQLLHSSGKYVNAYFDSVASQLKIIVVSVSGSLYTTKNITVVAGGKTLTENTDFGTTKIKVVEHNSTDVLIFLAGVDFSTDLFPRLFVVHYKINSGFYSIYQNVFYSAIYTDFSPLASVYYNSKYYIFTIINKQSSGSYIAYLSCIEYNPSTKIVTSKSNTAVTSAVVCGDAGSIIGLVQNSKTLSEIYLFFSTPDDLGTPKYYLYSLSTFTASGLAVSLLSTRWSADRHNLFVGGGNVTSGIYHYLYFAYVQSDSLADNTRILRITYNILQFNNSISTANFIAQNPRYYNLEQSLDTFYSANMWALGYFINSTQFIVFSPNDILGCFEGNVNNQLPDKAMKSTFYMPDFFDMNAYAIINTSVFADYNALPYYAHYNYMGRTYASNAVIDIDVVDIHSGTIFVFTGITPVIKTYAVTMAYTPADSIMLINKNYRFSINVKQNGINFYCNVIVNLDDINLLSGYTDINGIMQFTNNFGVYGIRKFTLNVYDGTTLAKTQDFSYYVPTPPTPAQPPQNPPFQAPDASVAITVLNGITATIVPLAIFFALALSFAKIAGLTGFISGIVIGLIVNVQLGFVPMYYIYMFAFIIAIGFAFIVMGKRGSPEG